jgi:hypothetical protein
MLYPSLMANVLETRDVVRRPPEVCLKAGGYHVASVLDLCARPPRHAGAGIRYGAMTSVSDE